MTIQTVSLAADLAMLSSGTALVVLAVAAAVQLVRRRRRSAAGLACAAGALIAVYGAALVAAGLAGSARQLRPGDTKCFDDWCAAMVTARQDVASGTLLVDVQLQNRGRGRAMRANLARAYVELPGGGRVAPRDGSALQALLQPGERADVSLTFLVPSGQRGVRFVVVEGAGTLGPGTFEIGGEGSPFHGVAGWPL
ncbi:MAG TPA: hypothetical protein VE953_28460 [Terriglobales bacterium]|nr:hypothetical protein [Terriglobales bacterium]